MPAFMKSFENPDAAAWLAGGAAAGLSGELALAQVDRSRYVSSCAAYFATEPEPETARTATSINPQPIDCFSSNAPGDAREFSIQHETKATSVSDALSSFSFESDVKACLQSVHVYVVKESTTLVVHVQVSVAEQHRILLLELFTHPGVGLPGQL